jgi:hypothetical protein
VTVAAAVGSAATVRATVAWRNAWRNQRNYDAAWIFVKVRAGGSWRHAPLASATAPRVTGGRPAAAFSVPHDRIGFFCFAAVPVRGDVRWPLELTVDLSALGDLPPDRKVEARVFGLEMVHVPTGGFTLGDPDAAALDYAAFYRSDARGGPAGLFEIRSEEAVPVAAEAGALSYQVKEPQYEGDRLGPVPAAFPKASTASTS